MIHPTLLIDHKNQIYVAASSHLYLKLFMGLVPGSEIMVTSTQHRPDDFEMNWFNYRYIHENREYVYNVSDFEFSELAMKINSFLDLWIMVVDKLNFVYERDLDPFKFNRQSESGDLVTLLRDTADRCQEIIVNNFHHGSFGDAKHNIRRELLLNMHP